MSDVTLPEVQPHPYVTHSEVEQFPIAVRRIEQYGDRGVTAELTIREDSVRISFIVTRGSTENRKKAAVELVKTLSGVDLTVEPAEISWPSTFERSPVFARALGHAFEIAADYADWLDRMYPAGEARVDVVVTEDEAKERSTCSQCLARTYRDEECACPDGGDAETFDEIVTGV